MINNMQNQLSSHTTQNILHNEFKIKSEPEIRPWFIYLLIQHTTGFEKDCGLDGGKGVLDGKQAQC